MGLFTWIIFGAIAGWLASIVTKRNKQQGLLMDIVTGVVGAFIGGTVMNMVTAGGFDIGFNIISLVVAVLGAAGLVTVMGMIRR